LNNKALVILSGGQDSTTCLYWAMDRFGQENVEAITFDYGQRHRLEIDCAKAVATQAGVRQQVLPIDTFAALGGNALTDANVEISTSAESPLPNTFVPGRNLIFLTFAAAYAWQNDIAHLVAGVAQMDYSGYPDCRQQTISAMQRAIELGMDRAIEIHTPLMDFSKKATVELANELGALDAMALTLTCYEGRQPPCGDCQACILRARGFEEAGIADPLLAA
jgi:7-cyano-7-deazaguanine synthase